ncbi:hypothetical protein Cch01nite_20430 [Cellulomonas chitinilytica]|uniref:Uncharacterized protein n=1 Tax=Cellulomonas chitinilytica TaxID=398759 RepID=A0A919P4P5_9CELL|nr:hypothetical protein [Cellulomonas chitinilytica]GIG21319.1 hypothetical protein Cch01nite_20430 [Cellulomonas chitinilytica]
MPLALAAAVAATSFTGISLIFLVGGVVVVALARIASGFPSPRADGPPRRFSELAGASREYLELHGANVGLRPGLATVVVRVLWSPLVMSLVLLWGHAFVDLAAQVWHEVGTLGASPFDRV